MSEDVEQSNVTKPPERRQGRTGIWTLSVANGDTVLALSEWGTQYEFECRAWEQLPVIVVPEWFDQWLTVEEDGKFYYYDPSNNHCGPFESREAAWRDCEEHPLLLICANPTFSGLLPS